MSYPIHSTQTAPISSKEALAGAEKAFGFVPNLLGTMAGAPALLKTYLSLGALFDETSFTATERQIVLLTTSYENGCAYCVGAHTIMSAMQKVPDDVVQAIREGSPIADKKWEALRRFTASMVATRGWPNAAETAAFHAAGYSDAQALEVVLGVGFKTLSNYTNHLAGTPLDATFAAAAWAKKT